MNDRVTRRGHTRVDRGRRTVADDANQLWRRLDAAGPFGLSRIEACEELKWTENRFSKAVEKCRRDHQKQYDRLLVCVHGLSAKPRYTIHATQDQSESYVDKRMRDVRARMHNTTVLAEVLKRRWQSSTVGERMAAVIERIRQSNTDT